MGNTSRRIKQQEGSDFVNKNPKVNIEDYTSIVNAIKKDADDAKVQITSIMKELRDPKDPFKLRMPALFAKAEQMVNELVKLRDDTKAEYLDLLKILMLDPKMPADQFCQMWDDFLVPEVKLLKFDAN